MLFYIGVIANFRVEHAYSEAQIQPGIDFKLTETAAVDAGNTGTIAAEYCRIRVHECGITAGLNAQAKIGCQKIFVAAGQLQQESCFRSVAGILRRQMRNAHGRTDKGL